MCELFGLSCNKKDRATLSLPVFGDYSSVNRDGWGVAYYDKDKAIVKKRAEKARTSILFQNVIRQGKSTAIISHIRYATSGEICDKNCHPFTYRYLNRDWCFAHNGQIKINYKSRVEGASDSARAFTYMMDKIHEYRSAGRIRGLYPAVLYATKELIKKYGGTLNYLLSDGTTLYAFNHYSSKPIYFLRRKKNYGGALLVSTQKLSRENWRKIPPDRLFVVSKGEVLVLSDSILKL